MAKIKLNNNTILIIAFAAMLLFIIVMLVFNPQNPNQPATTTSEPTAAETNFNVPANSNQPNNNDVVLVDPNLLATSSAASPNQAPGSAAASNPNSALTNATTNPKMSTKSEEQYFAVEQIEDYEGDAPNPSAQELIAQQADILGSEDFAAAGANAKLMLEDGLRSYFNLNPPPFVYRLIIIANTFAYNTQTGQGSFRLTVSNQQGNNEPDIRYNITFTANPPAIDFAKL